MRVVRTGQQRSSVAPQRRHCQSTPEGNAQESIQQPKRPYDHWMVHVGVSWSANRNQPCGHCYCKNLSVFYECRFWPFSEQCHFFGHFQCQKFAFFRGRPTFLIKSDQKLAFLRKRSKSGIQKRLPKFCRKKWPLRLECTSCNANSSQPPLQKSPIIMIFYMTLCINSISFRNGVLFGNST